MGHERLSGAGRLVLGGLVILFGAALLANNFGYTVLPWFRNWWAIFMLIPAISELSRARSNWVRNDRQFDHSVRGPLVSGVAILLVALMFIAELSWKHWWPLFVIYGGLCIMLSDRHK